MDFDISKGTPVPEGDRVESYEQTVYIKKKYWQLLGDHIAAMEHSPTMKINPGHPYTIRVDIMGFSKKRAKILSLLNEEKGFSLKIQDIMIDTAITLCKHFRSFWAFTQSDEITLLVTPTDNPTYQHLWGGKRDKLVSDAAGLASLTFTAKLYELTGCFFPIQFDARVAEWETLINAAKVLLWRAYDAGINGISDAIYVSDKKLIGLGTNLKVRALRDSGLLPLPEHQAYGTFIYRDIVTMNDINRSSGEETTIQRVQYKIMPRSNIVNRFYDNSIWHLPGIKPTSDVMG